MPALDKQVENEFIRVFGPKSAAVLSLLKASEFHVNHQVLLDRIAMAILMGSRGDESRFLNLLQLASVDYRDLLMETSMANDNWREVLKQNGYWCPPESAT